MTGGGDYRVHGSTSYTHCSQVKLKDSRFCSNQCKQGIVRVSHCVLTIMILDRVSQLLLGIRPDIHACIGHQVSQKKLYFDLSMRSHN